MNEIQGPKKRLETPVLFFFVAALVFGLGYSFITGPFQVPDEMQHFDRVYAVSSGNLFGNVDRIPSSIDFIQGLAYKMAFHANIKFSFSEILTFYSTPLNQSETVQSYFPNAAVYSPLPHAPQAVGVLIGRVVNLSPLALLIFGRILNLFVWIFLGVAAIHITPLFKWVFVILLLMPMSIFQAASVSADSLLNGISFLCLATLFRFIFVKDLKISLRQTAILILLVVTLAFCKPNYVVLFGLFLAIPMSKFSSKKNYFILAGLLFAVALLAAYLSLQIGKDLYMQFQGNGGAQPTNQIMILVNHPARFFTIALKSFQLFGEVYFKSYIGLLGWIDTPLPDILYISYPLILILVALLEHDKAVEVTLFQRAVFLIIPIIALGVIILALYVTWTAYGQGWVDGLQGRYLIPIVPPLFLILYNNRVNFPKRFIPILTASYTVIVSIVTLITLANRFYKG